MTISSGVALNAFVVCLRMCVFFVLWALYMLVCVRMYVRHADKPDCHCVTGVQYPRGVQLGSLLMSTAFSKVAEDCIGVMPLQRNECPCT